MAFECDASVVSAISVPGVRAQIMDYEWGAGARIDDQAPEVLLRLRLWPFSLQVRGWIDDGRDGSFSPLTMMSHNTNVHAHAGDIGEKVRTIECTFDRQWLSDIAEINSNWGVTDPASCLNFKHLNIEHSMRRLAEEIMEPDRSSHALIDALTVGLGVDLTRTLIEQEKGNKLADSNGTLSKAKLQHIEEYIRSYTLGLPSLAEVATECGLSVAHLRRVFKNTTGKTVHGYIEEIRIARAEQMLRDSNLRLKTIAYQLGFSHPSAFSCAFKKATGESPITYRSRFCTVFSVSTRDGLN